MKGKITSFVLLSVMLCIAVLINAQAPQLLNFQGVARSGTAILSTAPIGIQFTIHNQTSGGTALYTETQTASTNQYGLFTAKIGNGMATLGTFSSIDWSSGDKYLEVDIDPTGGNNYQTLSTTQLLSVPFALNAGNGVPPGTIIAYAGANIPAGWLACDGSTVTVASYPALFNAIGTAWGNASNNNLQFNLPDLRGQFLRGVNGTAANNAGVTASNDPDALHRTTSTGGNTGNNVGSYETDTLKSHSHALTPVVAISGGTEFCATGNTYGFGPAISSTNLSGGAETRPKNAYVNYIIKY